MDSLKTLIDRKEYDLIIKLTKNSQDADDLFYLIAAYTFKGEYENALYVIQDHQTILQSKLANLIRMHIELLCALERFEQARTVLDYYANLPYESQQVEEILRDMPKVIEAEEKKKYAAKYFSEEQVIEKLQSKDNQEVLFAIELLKTRDVLMFLNEIKLVLLSHPSRTIRSLALMLLVQKEVDRNIQFNDGKELLVVNPKNLKQPFTGEEFNKYATELEKGLSNSSEAQVATNLLLTYAIYVYPHSVGPIDINLLTSFIYLSKKYMGQEVDLSTLVIEKQADLSTVEQCVNLIHEIEQDV